MTRLGKFVFKLEPLLKKHQWEMQELQSELAQLNKVVAEKCRELETLNRQKSEVEQRIVDAMGNNQNISIEQRRIESHYLKYQYLLIQEKQNEVDRDNVLVEQVRTQLISKKQSLSIIERHKSHKSDEHQVEQIKASIIEADENWLLRR